MMISKLHKYIRVLLHLLFGGILLILLIIPAIIHAAYVRLTDKRCKHVPLYSHFLTRIIYVGAAVFPYQVYPYFVSARTVVLPGDSPMIVKRADFLAYWVGWMDTRKVPSDLRGGKPTYKVSLSAHGEHIDIIMLYAHGGGFVFGEAEMYNNTFCSWVRHFKEVHNKNLRVLTVDYDLAPQKKFPTQREQFLSAYRFLINDIKWNPQKVIFGGDSAGGNIILSAMFKIQEPNSGLPPPRAILCVSPWVRLDADFYTSPSLARNRVLDFMPPQKLPTVAHAYKGTQHSASDPEISPFYIKDHSNFPEMGFIYSADEILRDDCARYVDIVQQTGGRVTFHAMEPGMPHVFPMMRELAGLTAFKDAERRVMEWINHLDMENKKNGVQYGSRSKMSRKEKRMSSRVTTRTINPNVNAMMESNHRPVKLNHIIPMSPIMMNTHQYGDKDEILETDDSDDGDDDDDSDDSDEDVTMTTDDEEPIDIMVMNH